MSLDFSKSKKKSALTNNQNIGKELKPVDINQTIKSFSGTQTIIRKINLAKNIMNSDTS